MNKQNDQLLHKKRLGQYFSGRKIAELLVSLLPEDDSITSVTDPMAGTGDLLQAAVPEPDRMIRALGVEIDKETAKRCRKSLNGIRVVNKDAFCCRELVTDTGWDLVITNPPYVRYQLQSDDASQMPSKNTIRENLIRQISSLKHLNARDRELLINLSQKYSGLSDMAVPAWLLCAALVREGGILAMVVPDTWLNREYAGPIQYLLLKCFDISVIAKDVNAAWFSDALVRTCLVIARRKTTAPLKESDSHKTMILNLTAQLAGTDSLIEHLAFQDATGFDALKQLLRQKQSHEGQGYSVEVKRTADLFPFMLYGPRKQKWISPEDLMGNLPDRSLPEEINRALRGQRKSYVSLEDLGLQCGQGLRTGANDFFYLETEAYYGNGAFIKNRKWQDSGRRILIPDRYMVRSICNRNEISGICVDPGQLKKALLYISNEVRASDLPLCSPDLKPSFRILDEAVAEYITRAELYSSPRGLRFKDYSAVRPNEKKDALGYRRFWYMLPPLTRRHLPNLCMTRVGVSACECIYVPQSEKTPLAVDANFVTLWSDSMKTVHICLALLNSTWSRCYLELICTVMGGGALKVEANHVRKLLFPPYSTDQLDRLEAYGKRITDDSVLSPALLHAIDQTVFEPFTQGDAARCELELLMNKKLTERGART